MPVRPQQVGGPLPVYDRLIELTRLVVSQGPVAVKVRPQIEVVGILARGGQSAIEIVKGGFIFARIGLNVCHFDKREGFLIIIDVEGQGPLAFRYSLSVSPLQEEDVREGPLPYACLPEVASVSVE